MVRRGRRSDSELRPMVEWDSADNMPFLLAVNSNNWLYCPTSRAGGIRSGLVLMNLKECHSVIFRLSQKQEENRMEIFIIAVLTGLIPPAIAQSKGQSVPGFCIYGALLFIMMLCFSR